DEAQHTGSSRDAGWYGQAIVGKEGNYLAHNAAPTATLGRCQERKERCKCSGWIGRRHERVSTSWRAYQRAARPACRLVPSFRRGGDVSPPVEQLPIQPGDSRPPLAKFSRTGALTSRRSPRLGHFSLSVERSKHFPSLHAVAFTRTSTSPSVALKLPEILTSP